jgi:hypothetical protein
VCVCLCVCVCVCVCIYIYIYIYLGNFEFKVCIGTMQVFSFLHQLLQCTC